MLERGAVRYTPAGLPAFDMVLKHESQVSQDGQPRQVSVEIKARAIGEITGRLSQVDVGSQHSFGGFLGSQRNGRGVVFHITELQPADPA